jgi:predicted ABC-type ATPase
MPYVVILAGPNGARNSTSAPAVIDDLLAVGAIVNADVIARGLSAFDSESVAFQAGRILLERLQELAAQRADFAFETTLASRTFAPYIRELRAAIRAPRAASDAYGGCSAGPV